MNINPKAATEVLEIVKYLDDDLKKIVNQEIVSLLEQVCDKNYNFEINKNIPLYDNLFMDETYELLKILFSTKETVNE